MTNTAIQNPTLRFKQPDGTNFPNWEEKKLGEVAEIVGGGTPDSTAHEYWNGNIIWYTPTEIKKKYLSNSTRSITALGLQKSSAKLLPVGTLLLSSRATIGDVSIAKTECSTNQGFQNLIVNQKNHNEYWYYWLLYNKRELIRRSSGSTFLEINKTEISKILTIRPHLDEQKKIAGFLSCLDTKIELLQSKHTKMLAYKKGLIQGIFSQNIRFKDKEKNFPEWEEKKLGEVIQTKTFKSKSNNIVNNGNFCIIDMGAVSPCGKILHKKYTNLNEDILNIGDLVMPKDDIGDGSIIGKVAIIEKDNLYVCGDHIFKINSDTHSNYFIKYLINSNINNKKIRRICQGSPILGLSAVNLQNVKLYLSYNLDEQKKIADFLSIVDERIEKLEQKINKTKAFKNGVMQQMFV